MRMTMQRAGRIGLTAGTVGMALLLAACGSTKLLGKSLPDETQVIDGPSLALPPQFELRPPRQSADYESLLRAQKGTEARNLITTGTSATVAGVAVDASASVPAADTWLVDKTSAQTGVVTDPNVRADLAKVKTPEEVKAKEDTKAKKGWLGRWFSRNDDADDE